MNFGHNKSHLCLKAQVSIQYWQRGNNVSLMSFMLVPFLEARIEHKRTNGRSSDLSLFVWTNLPKFEWRVKLAPLIQWFILLYWVRISHSKRLTAAGLFRTFTWFPLSRSQRANHLPWNTVTKLYKSFYMANKFRKKYLLFFLYSYGEGRVILWRA